MEIASHSIGDMNSPKVSKRIYKSALKIWFGLSEITKLVVEVCNLAKARTQKRLWTILRRKSTSQIVKQRLLDSLEPRHQRLHLANNCDTGSENIDLQNDELTSQIRRLRIGKWKEQEAAAKNIRNYAKVLRDSGKQDDAVYCLINLIYDDDWLVRWTSVEALAWLSSNVAVPELINAMHDSNWKVQVAAIHALTRIGDHQAISAIREYAYDANALVREAAIEAMGNMAEVDTIPVLMQAIHDVEEFVRISAVDALGKTRDKSVSAVLLSALEDVSLHVRWAAANALLDTATSEAIPRLRKSLNDTEGPYWEQKRICDVIAEILARFDSNISVN